MASQPNPRICKCRTNLTDCKVYSETSAFAVVYCASVKLCIGACLSSNRAFSANLHTFKILLLAVFYNVITTIIISILCSESYYLGFLLYQTLHPKLQGAGRLVWGVWVVVAEAAALGEGLRALGLFRALWFRVKG